MRVVPSVSDSDNTGVFVALRPSKLSGPILTALLLGAVLVGSAVLTYRNTEQLAGDAQWVGHTHDVIARLENVLSLMKDAETGQRGFLVTGDPTYLAPYEEAVKSVRTRVDELQQKTMDNPLQQARFPDLRVRVGERLRELERNLRLRQNEGLEAARAGVMSGRGKTEMDALRVVVAEMVQRERDLLQARSERTDRTFRWALVTGVLSGATALAALIGFVVLSGRYLIARERSTFVMAEQAERLRTTLASIGDAVITTDTENRITNMNAVAESLTGWTVADAAGEPLESVFRIVNEETRLKVDNPAVRALAEGLIVGLANHTLLIARDGSERPIDDSAAPIRCKEGEVVGCVLVFRDISERQQAAHALAAVDRRKDEFLATLAHELRNPLAPLRSALELSKRSANDPVVLARAQETMERQLGHLVRLVDDLLDVNRISQDKLELRRAPVELGVVIQQAVETVRSLAEASEHKVEIALPNQPIFVDADAMRLAQVFSNLLHNACKFTPPGGQVKVIAERVRDDVAITVRDNGVGIPQSMLPKIFDMFTQVDQSLERVHGGLGIGLTLVQRLVGMHGGSVVAASRGRGQGSEFIVTLPTVPAPGPSSDSAALEPARSTPRRILVVDDNHDAADLLTALLRLGGNETEKANDGLAALEAAARFQPDVVLLDIGLPRMNGYDVARELRKQPGGDNIIVVALTGWGQDQDRAKSAAAGFDGHLVKPVDHDALMGLLSELYSIKSAQADRS